MFSQDLSFFLIKLLSQFSCRIGKSLHDKTMQFVQFRSFSLIGSFVKIRSA